MFLDPNNPELFYFPTTQIDLPEELGGAPRAGWPTGHILLPLNGSASWCQRHNPPILSPLTSREGKFGAKDPGRRGERGLLGLHGRAAL